MGCTCIQILPGIFCGDPATDLQSARICLQRRKCLLPGLLVISAVFAV